MSGTRVYIGHPGPGVKVTASSLRGYAPVGLPIGAVDSDPHTAWSPSAHDESVAVLP